MLFNDINEKTLEEISEDMSENMKEQWISMSAKPSYLGIDVNIDDDTYFKIKADKYREKDSMIKSIILHNNESGIINKKLIIIDHLNDDMLSNHDISEIINEFKNNNINVIIIANQINHKSMDCSEKDIPMFPIQSQFAQQCLFKKYVCFCFFYVICVFIVCVWMYEFCLSCFIFERQSV